MHSVRTLLAALACLPGLTGADMAMQSGAQAQYCPAVTLNFILRDGRNVSIFYCERDRYWSGIAAESIDARGDTQTIDGVRQPKPAIQSFPRSAVRFLCYSKCPGELPAVEAKEDTVVWKNGSRTTGRISRGCDQGRCRLHQDGKAVGSEFVGWQLIPNDMSYIEFGSAAAQ
jgi:hypothetical protein